MTLEGSLHLQSLVLRLGGQKIRKNRQIEARIPEKVFTGSVKKIRTRNQVHICLKTFALLLFLTKAVGQPKLE